MNSLRVLLGEGQGVWGRGQAAGTELVGQPRHKVRAALLLEVAMLPGQEAARGPGPHVISAGGLHPRSVGSSPLPYSLFKLHQ